MAGKPFDATMKELIEADPAAWAARLGAASVLEATLVDSELSTVTAAADKVIRVRHPWGMSLINVEPESSDASESPEQLLLYSAALNRRHRQPVRSVLLLLRPSAEREEANGLLVKYHRPPNLREVGEVPYLVFHYDVQRLWTWSVDELLSGPSPLAALAPLTDEAVADPVPVVVRSLRRIEEGAETSSAQKDKLETALSVLLRLRFTSEMIDRILEGVRAMEGTAFERFIERHGKAYGERLAEGLAESRAVRRLIDTLKRVGGVRLGVPDEATDRRIDALTDVDRLGSMFGRLSEASSWDDLLSSP